MVLWKMPCTYWEISATWDSDSDLSNKHLDLVSKPAGLGLESLPSKTQTRLETCRTQTQENVDSLQLCR